MERDRALQLLLQQQRPLDVRASIRRLDRQRQLLRFLALRRVGSNTFGSGAAELVGKTPGAWRVRALATIVPCSAHAPCSVQVQARSSAISSCWLSYRPYGTTPSPALPRASAGPPHAHRSCARGPSIAATKERPSGVHVALLSAHLCFGDRRTVRPDAVLSSPLLSRIPCSLLWTRARG